MNSLMLLILGLLCFGSGILAQKNKRTPNQQPGVQHFSSDPDKTLIRILPYGVELSHDKNLAVQLISSLPTEKCKKSAKQKQYQRLRTYLRRNLKQLGRGIIVLTNLTKTQSQDVADLTTIINSRENDDCEEEINTKGITRLIHAVMMAVQNHNSHQPPRTLSKAFKNKKIVFPFHNRLQSHLEEGLPHGYKRMAFSQGGMPGATPRSEREGKPITAFEKKSTTYFEFPTMSDEVWSDPVENNKTNPMLLIIGQRPVNSKTNKKIFKYYDLPLTEDKTKGNTDGDFRSLNKRWKMHSQTDTTVHCTSKDNESFSSDMEQVKITSDKTRSRIRTKALRPNKQSSAEFDGENKSDENQEDNGFDSSETDTKSSKLKQKGERRPKSKTFKEIDRSFNDQQDNELGAFSNKPMDEDYLVDDVLLKAFPITDGMNGEADDSINDFEKLKTSTQATDDNDSEDRPSKVPTYDAMLTDFPITDETDRKPDSIDDSEKLITSTQATDDNESDDTLSKMPTYDAMLKDFPLADGTDGEADSTHGFEDFKTPSQVPDDNESEDDAMLTDFPISDGSESGDSIDFKASTDENGSDDRLSSVPVHDEIMNDFPISDDDGRADSTYDSQDFKTPDHTETPSEETDRIFNDRQDYELAKYHSDYDLLVDEDDLDYDYDENYSPKVPRYDEMLKDFDLTSDFDYSKFDAMDSGEDNDFYMGAFDMDMEIDPWIF